LPTFANFVANGEGRRAENSPFGHPRSAGADPSPILELRDTNGASGPRIGQWQIPAQGATRK